MKSVELGSSGGVVTCSRTRAKGDVRAYRYHYAVGILACSLLFLAGVTSDAQEVVELQSGEIYWHARFLGEISDVQESGDELVGKAHGLHDTRPFRIKKALVEDQLAKTKGAKSATRQLIWTMHGNRLITGLMPYYRRKLHEFTGQSFVTHEEWLAWFRSNEQYLVWSEKAGHLVVDEKAKKAGIPVDEYRKAEPLRR